MDPSLCVLLYTLFLTQITRLLHCEITTSRDPNILRSRDPDITTSRHHEIPRSRYHEIPSSRYHEITRSRYPKIPISRHNDITRSRDREITRSQFHDHEIPISQDPKIAPGSYTSDSSEAHHAGTHRTSKNSESGQSFIVQPNTDPQRRECTPVSIAWACVTRRVGGREAVDAP